jgi:hypothetical protein
VAGREADLVVDRLWGQEFRRVKPLKTDCSAPTPVSVLDHSELNGAVCQFLDVRTLGAAGVAEETR